MVSEDILRRMIGFADCCELMAAAFSFPDDGLADALSNGSFAVDVESCLHDVGSTAHALNAAKGSLSLFSEASAGELKDVLPKGCSLLYFSPGSKVPVWPFEAAFLFVASGREGVPSMFQSPVTIDVERHMREAGVLPKGARQEPADSVWDEFSFMSYLYGNVAKALHEGREGDATEWSGRVVRFWDEHASRWLPAFMEKTIEEAPRRSFGVEYAALAEVGLLILGAIRVDVESMRTEA